MQRGQFQSVAIAANIGGFGSGVNSEYAEQMLAKRTVRSAEDERRLWAGYVADSPLSSICFCRLPTSAAECS